MEKGEVTPEDLIAIAKMSGIELTPQQAQNFITNVETTVSKIQSFPDALLADVQPAYIAPLQPKKARGKK